MVPGYERAAPVPDQIDIGRPGDMRRAVAREASAKIVALRGTDAAGSAIDGRTRDRIRGQGAIAWDDPPRVGGPKRDAQDFHDVLGKVLRYEMHLDTPPRGKD